VVILFFLSLGSLKNRSHKIVLALLICFSFFTIAAKTKSNNSKKGIDSLLIIRKTVKTDDAKLDVYQELAWRYRHVSTKIAKLYSDSTIMFADKLHKPNIKWYGLNSKAEALRLEGNLVEALSLHQQALLLAESDKLLIKVAHSCNNIGIVLREQKNQGGAIEYTEKARKIYTELNDTNGVITVCINLGNSYRNLEKFEEAYKIYNEGLRLSLIKNDLLTIGKFYTNMGHGAFEQGQYAKAKELYYKSLITFERLGSLSEIAEAYANYGYMVWMDGDVKSGLTYYQKALAINRETGNNWRLKDVYSYMAELYLDNKDFKNAYYYADSARKYKDIIFNEENARSLNEMQERFDSEKKQIAIDGLSKENAFKEKKNQQQKLIIIVVGLALVISIVMGVLVYKQYKEKNKAHHVIAEQKEALEEKQREIVDSINYAKRIQYTLLAHDDFLKTHLPEHFVYFHPKDIVSGDFYWATERNNKFFLAVCDSTGHGVPGAFMSLLNISFLNEAVNEKGIEEPNQIFDFVRQRLIDNINKDGQKDGFDGILLCFDRSNNSITYAAAHNNPIVIQNNNLVELPAGRMPVGISESKTTFQLFKLNAQKGDTIYLYTDGYADQFGGPKGKKLKYKQLNEILTANHSLSMHAQKEMLHKNFTAWKGQLEQVDDVCILGIKL